MEVETIGETAVVDDPFVPGSRSGAGTAVGFVSDPLGSVSGVTRKYGGTCTLIMDSSPNAGWYGKWYGPEVTFGCGDGINVLVEKGWDSFTPDT
jgi:hypothetical protein